MVRRSLNHPPLAKDRLTNIVYHVVLRFDIYSFGFDVEEDEEGMRQSAGMINELIKYEISNGTDPSRIVLGGFSQGATMSLLTGLTGELKLAGLVVLSGWLPLKQKFKQVSIFQSLDISHKPFLSLPFPIPFPTDTDPDN